MTVSRLAAASPASAGMTAPADLDRSGRELNVPRAPRAPGCGRPVSLADELRFLCPRCHDPAYAGSRMCHGLAADMAPGRAAENLIELGARRDRLGLPP
jgi:hypothetical protein